MNLEQYKNTYIKLLNLTNFTEVYGLLVDFDDKNNICLHKGIIVANRMAVNFASTMNQIIQFKYNDNEGGLINSILCPNHDNDTEGGGRKISWINLSGWVITPIHSNETEPTDEVLEYRNIIKGWIDNVYSDYSEMLEYLPTINNNQDNEKDNQTNSEKNGK